MNTSAVYDGGFSKPDLKMGFTRVRDFVLLGFESMMSEKPSVLVSEWSELSNCFAVQVALEEESSYATRVVTTEGLYRRGYELLDNTSAPEMAKYLSTENPLFWAEMVTHNKELDSLLV